MKYMEQHILEVTEHFVSPEERTRLLRYCLKMVGDKDVAEDLVQETLLEAWKHLHTLRDASRRTQWLSGVARNVCLRWMRTSSRHTAHLIDPLTGQNTPSIELAEQLTDDFDIEVELERKELVELLDRAMALLPPETRAVLVKRYVEDSPLQEVATELGMNVSAVAMRLQRGKLALRRVLITDLREEIAPYAVRSIQSIEAMQGQWEETPFWCFQCGQHRLLGIRNPEEGRLLLNCPGCNPGTDRVMSYNDLPLLKGVRGFRPLLTRLRNWCSHYYWTGLHDGSILCESCGRMLPVRICRADAMPEWVHGRNKWASPYPDRLIAILCEHCRASYRTTLEYLVLDLPEGRQFLQAHPRIRTLPSQEVEAEGRRAIITRHESVTDNATLTTVVDYETYKMLRVERSDR